MGFQLGNLYVEKGEKVCGFLKLPFTEDELPVTLIYGQEDGHTVLVDGGIHNAEYVGIECVTGLAAKLQPKDIKGILILLHIVNVNGFKARTVSVSAEDGKNLNRVFPGDANGTYTDKLAYFIEKEIFSKIDYYIDVHNGDWFEDLTPFIYCVGNAPEETVAEAERMAQAADMPFYVKSQSGKGGAYNYAGTLGIPSVLIERGCNGMWSEEEVAASQKDVKNILRRIGMLKTRPTLAEMQMRVPKHMNHAHYVDSEKAGCWFPKKKAGQIVKAGELLGELKDYFGNVIEEFRLKEDAIILYQTISYSVPENSPLIAYGHYDICIDDMGNTHQHTHDELHKHRKEHYDDHAGIHSREMWEDMI